MLKKTSATVKTCIVFSIDFLMFFRQKSMQSRLKSMKIGFVHRNRRKSMFRKSFFIKISIFAQFLESLWVPGGLPGRPGASQNPSFFSLIFSCVWKRARTVPRGAPRVPRGTPRVPFWVEFWIDFTCQKTSNRISNIRETSQKLLTKLERNVIQVCRSLNGGRPKGANDCDDCFADYQGRVIPFPILAGPEWWAPWGRQW